MHALHTPDSPFAGMLMFTEAEVERLRTLVNVSRPSQCGLYCFHLRCRVHWSSQNLKLSITPTLLLATSVYTIPYLSCPHLVYPKSRISGSQQVCQPRSFGLFNQLSSTMGKFPLSNRRFPDNDLDVVEDLLTGAEIEFALRDDVTYSRCVSPLWSCIHAEMV